jgi:hypothetical protein
MTSIHQLRCPQSAFLTVESRLAQSRDSPRIEGVQPEFRACLVALNVHMGWLVPIRRVKEKTVWSLPKNRRQRSQFTRSARSVGSSSGRLRTLCSIGRHTPSRDVRAAYPRADDFACDRIQAITPHNRAYISRSMWSSSRLVEVTALRASGRSETAQATQSLTTAGLQFEKRGFRRAGRSLSEQHWV